MGGRPVIFKYDNLEALEFSVNGLQKYSDTDDSELCEDNFGRPVSAGMELPDALEKIFDPALQSGGVSDVSWDEQVSAPLTKTAELRPFANPLNFSKSSIGYKLRVTRVEHKTHDDGEKWAYAFSGDELVDAHLIRGE
jgi:hypothetical protein